MSTLESRIAEARPHLQPGWSDDRADAVARSLRLRRRARARARTAIAGASVLVALAAFAALRSRPEPTPELAGVQVTRVGKHTNLELLQLSPDEAHVALHHGGAWFDAEPGPQRKIQVEIGPVDVRFEATRVLVEQVATGARIFVERGEAQITWAGGSARLGPGDEGTFPPVAPLTPVAPPTVSPPPIMVVNEVPPPKPVVRREPVPEAVAELPETPAIPELSPPAGPAPTLDVPAALLAQADAARSAGRAADAVLPLTRLMDEHPSDPRAPLAAFTLGRVLLDSLDRPHDAAEAFSRARRLWPDSVLSEDALAREVDARGRAGESAQAKSLAREYLSRFPEGGRARAMRAVGEQE